MSDSAREHLGAGKAPVRRPPYRYPAHVLAAGLTAALALIGLAWTLSLPVNGAADEGAHFVKALGTVSADPFGTRPPVPSGPLTPQQAFLDRNKRTYTVPAALNPSDTSTCFILRPDVSAACAGPPALGSPSATTYVGTYPPLAYVAPGVLARLGGNRAQGLLFARLGCGATTVLMWLAAACSYLGGAGRRHWLIAGLLLAATPAAVFLGFCENPNGAEAAAGLAFAATLLGATRPAGQADRWRWALVAASGSVLSTSRPISFVWTVVIAVAVAGVRGRRRFAGSILGGGRPAAWALGVVTASMLTTAAWDEAMGAAAPPGSRNWVELASSALHQFWSLQAGVVSQIDWGEVGATGAIPRLWEVLVGLLLMAAFTAATRYQRLALAGVLVLYYLCSVGLVGLSTGSGFPTGGRYLLAVYACIPLLGAELAQESSDRRQRVHPAQTLVVALIVVTCSALQLCLLYASGRRYAVGRHGTLGFLWTGAQWRPPAGWIACAALAVLGGLGLVAAAGAGLLPARGRHRRSRWSHQRARGAPVPLH